MPLAGFELAVSRHVRFTMWRTRNLVAPGAGKLRYGEDDDAEMCYGSSTSNMLEGDDSTDGMVDIIFIWPAPLIWGILSANPDHFPLIGCSKINSSLIRSCYPICTIAPTP